jgi:hypothetical protein
MQSEGNYRLSAAIAALLYSRAKQILLYQIAVTVLLVRQRNPGPTASGRGNSGIPSILAREDIVDTVCNVAFSANRR